MNASVARVLFVHAHPDDESLTTGGTIAGLRRRGHDVRVITCTLGEQGEVIGDRWARLVAEEADQLGGLRIGELASALGELGVDEPHFLGGAGRFRDSGMAGTPAAAHPRAFVSARAEATRELVAVIDGYRPHVVVTYDARGGYGHPDHIAAHDVTVAAVDAAGWEVPRLCFTVSCREDVDAALGAVRGVPRGWVVPRPEELPGHPEAGIDLFEPVSDADADARDRALAAHATQVVVGDPREIGLRAFALSNGILQPSPMREGYVVARDRTGVPHPRHLLDGVLSAGAGGPGPTG